MPNVLTIVLDDVNGWLTLAGSYGGQLHTPNIDRLAATGVSFTEAHAAVPLCNPSRTSVLSGMSPLRTGVVNNVQPMFEAVAPEQTLPMILGAAGWETAVAGKVFHHLSTTEAGRVYDHVLHLPIDLVERGQDGIIQTTKLFRAGVWTEDPALLADSRTVSAVEDFLAGYAPQPGGAGLLLDVGLINTHGPWVVPQDFYDLYPLDEIVLPERPAGDLDDVPEYGRLFADPLIVEQMVTADDWRANVQAYLATISFMDAMVGRLLDALAASTIADDTLVVLWSDNGYHMGDKESLAKNTLWATATRTPLIIADPAGARAGVVEEQVVGLPDIYPTILAYAGLPIPDWASGHSLLELVRSGDPAGLPDMALSMVDGSYSLRTAQYRYTRYEDGGEELYDVLADPREYVNLAADPAADATRTTLSATLDAMLAEHSIVQQYSATPTLLEGDAGANLMVAGFGADTLVGGDGSDTYLLRDPGQIVVEGPDGGTDTVLIGAGIPAYVIPDQVERVAIGRHDGVTAMPRLYTVLGNGSDNSIRIGEGAMLSAYGGDGNDSISGRARAFTLDGGAGDDTLIGTTGPDRLLGGAGNDRMTSKLGVDTLLGGAGNDILAGNDGADVLQGGPGEDRLVGGTGNDQLAGDDGQDLLFGEDGNDTLSGDEGDDRLDGGGGTDTAIIASQRDDFAVTRLAGGHLSIADLRAGAPQGADTLGGIEWLRFLDALLHADFPATNAADTLNGTAQAETIAGLGGHDRIFAQGGADSLLGGAGADTLIALEGDDTLDGGPGADSLSGGAGNDLYLIDNILDRAGDGTGEGADTIHATVDARLPNNIEVLVLLGAALYGTGNNQANLIIGNTGANTLAGLGGADTMEGGLGDDTYRVDALDIISELPGGGIDRVIATRSFSIEAFLEVENLTFTGTAATVGTGNAADNPIIGNAGPNRLEGLGDNDSLHGGLGNDTLRGGEGADSLFGGGGLDRLEGGPGDDIYRITEAGTVAIESVDAGTDQAFSIVSFALPNNVENLTLLGGNAIDGTGNALANAIVGNGLANLLEGRAGADSVSGGNGNDTLIGGAGADTIFGGNGVDILRYASSAHGLDLILDYNVVQDTIEVSAAGFGGGLVEGMSIGAAGRFVANTTGKANAPAGTGQFIYNTDTRTLLFDVDGVGQMAARALATFQNTPIGFGASEVVVIA